jgi:SAM-dependent methyltransferase
LTSVRHRHDFVSLATRFRRLVGKISIRRCSRSPRKNFRRTGFRRIASSRAICGSILNFFPRERFSLVTCLGNTIPHLTSREDIAVFFSSAFACLEPGGSFIFQIVNYDRVLDFAVRNLPLIARDGISFDRLYSAPYDSGLIDFNTVSPRSVPARGDPQFPQNCIRCGSRRRRIPAGRRIYALLVFRRLRRNRVEARLPAHHRRVFLKTPLARSGEIVNKPEIASVPPCRISLTETAKIP